MREGSARKFLMQTGETINSAKDPRRQIHAHVRWKFEIAKWRANWGTPSSAPRQYGNHYNYVSSPYINIP